ncbi:MAG TPA: hypothetical protein VMR46_03295 [Candidatus Paceibacterota bacterium]|nr:hypothetical protein [Candidatus Paceibacterota bacterium]
MKDFLKRVFRTERTGNIVVSKTNAISRRELEVKAKKGATKAIKEYRRVFERLAEYDRA